jgi:outer membrane protein assembly factor BamB
MKKKFSLLILLFALVSHFACKPDLPGNVCRVIYLAGDATTTAADGTSSKLKHDDILPSTASVTTGPGSVVDLEFSDGNRIRVQENSSIRLSRFFDDQNLETTNIYVELGKFFTTMDQFADGTRYTIETDSVVLSTEGADLVIIVTNDKVSKVAVSDGRITYARKLDFEELETLRKSRPEMADRIEGLLIQETEVSANQKIEILPEEIKAVEEQLTRIIREANHTMGDHTDDIEKTEQILKDFTSVIEALIMESNETTVVAVDDADWEGTFSKNEIEMLRLDATSDKVKSTTTTLEKPVIEKVGTVKGIRLSDENIGLTAKSNQLYLTTAEGSVLYCIDPVTARLKWKFTDPLLENMYGYAVESSGQVIVGSPLVLIAVSNGNKVTEKGITRGPLFWSKPVETGGFLYIPTGNAIYTFRNKTFSELIGLGDVSGQIFLTTDSKRLFFADMNSKVVSVYDIAAGKITWESNILADRPYTEPVSSGGYLFIADGAKSIYRFSWKQGDVKGKIIHAGSGVVSNLILHNQNLYFVANDGNLYIVDMLTFDMARNIESVDSADRDFLLSKELLEFNGTLLFCSSHGKLFSYDTVDDTVTWYDLPGKTGERLVGSPVLVDDSVYFLSNVMNLYRWSRR